MVEGRHRCVRRRSGPWCHGGPGRLILFAVDANGSLEWSTNTGTGWSGWTSIGTAVMGAPAVVCSQPHRIDVVAWQTDLSLRHSSYDGSHWSAWQSLSGVVDAPPALASLAPGRLILAIARGTDHAIYHKWMMLAGWSPSWEYMGGNFVGTHAIVATSGNRLDIVARAADDSVWHKEWNGASWVPGVTQWRPLGGTIVDSPRLLSSPARDGAWTSSPARATAVCSTPHSILRGAGTGRALLHTGPVPNRLVTVGCTNSIFTRRLRIRE